MTILNLKIQLFQREGDKDLNHSSYNGELRLDITTKLRILASSERFNKTLITYSNLFFHFYNILHILIFFHNCSVENCN